MKHDSENALKAKVIERLRQTRRFGAKPIIATEFCIGSTGVRADLVIASRGSREMIAIEIKSASDSLRRLHNQLDVYTRYFDRVIVVAAHRHQKRVRLLQYAGLEIWEVEPSGSLAVVRDGLSIPPPASFKELLTAREMARYRGLLVRDSDGERDAFFAAFDDRHGNTSRQFWSDLTGKVTVPSLSGLSRFEAERGELKRRVDYEAQLYASWASLAAA